MNVEELEKRLAILEQAVYSDRYFEPNQLEWQSSDSILSRLEEQSEKLSKIVDRHQSTLAPFFHQCISK